MSINDLPEDKSTCSGNLLDDDTIVMFPLENFTIGALQNSFISLLWLYILSFNHHFGAGKFI